MDKLMENERLRLYAVHRNDFPKNTYVMCSDSVENILYRPNMAGNELQKNMEKVAEELMQVIAELVLKGEMLQNITEVVFLAGGLYYQLNHGFKKKFNEAIPQCFLGIKRQRVEGSDGEFTAVATYENFESLPDNATIIIGDTIATGATLEKGIYHIFETLQTKKMKLENLVICSLACSVNGAQKMKDIEKRMKLNFPDAKAHLIVCEELFHLMPDGTDLRFLYDDCVMPEETRKRIMERYGQKLGKEMKCAVFDWGTRCKNPIKHYHEFLEYVDNALKQDQDEKTMATLQKMKKETEESLETFERII